MTTARNDASKHVLVLDDEPAICDALQAYLEREGFRVTVTRTLAQALDAYRIANPDLMILDVTLPDGSGLDVLRAASDDGRRTPAIVLTARGDEIDRIVGLELGADDYVTKPFSPREVVARVRAIIRRASGAQHAASPRDRIAIGDLEIDLSAYEVRVAGRDAGLTPTEFRLLRVLAERPGRTFTRAALLDALHDDGSIFERTLDRHINNLRKKIEADVTRPAYVQTVYGIGYKMRAKE